LAEVRQLAVTLERSDRLGTPVALHLRALAREVRAERRAAEAERARRAPVLMLFPLVFLILPAFVLVFAFALMLEFALSLTTIWQIFGITLRTPEAVRSLGALHVEALRLDHPVREGEDLRRFAGAMGSPSASQNESYAGA
jgi:hypothetical protein